MNKECIFCGKKLHNFPCTHCQKKMENNNIMIAKLKTEHARYKKALNDVNDIMYDEWTYCGVKYITRQALEG